MRRVIGVGLAVGLLLGLGAAPPAGATSYARLPMALPVPLIQVLSASGGEASFTVQVRNAGDGPTGLKPRFQGPPEPQPTVLLLGQGLLSITGDGWDCSVPDRRCETLAIVDPGASLPPLTARARGQLRVTIPSGFGDRTGAAEVPDPQGGAVALLSALEPAYGLQYGRARLVVRAGSQDLAGPVGVRVLNEGGQVRPLASGAGWSCQQSQPGGGSLGLTCLHAGPLAAGAALPQLLVTKTPPGTRLVAELDPGTPSTLLIPSGFGGSRSTFRTTPTSVVIVLSRPSWAIPVGTISFGLTGGRDLPFAMTCAPGPCGGGPVTRVVLTPSDPFDPGVFYRVSIAAPAVQDRDATRSLVPVRAVQQDRLVQRWARATDPSSFGGSEFRASLAGETFRMPALSGLRLWYTSGPDQGRARLMVDGRKLVDVDQWSPVRRHRQSVVLLGGVPPDSRLTLLVLGSKRARSTGTAVSLDGVSYNERCDGLCLAGPRGEFAWRPAPDPTASDRVVVQAATPGAVLSTRFGGRGVDVLHQVGPAAGSFAVLVDGKRVRTVDARRSARGLATTSIRGLEEGAHLVEVVVVRGLVGVDAVVAR